MYEAIWRGVEWDKEWGVYNHKTDKIILVGLTQSTAKFVTLVLNLRSGKDD